MCGSCVLDMLANVTSPGDPFGHTCPNCGHTFWVAVAAAQSIAVPFACAPTECGTGPAGCGHCLSVNGPGVSGPVGFGAVVIDTCVHARHPAICPAKPGEKNQRGFEHHLRFFDDDAGRVSLKPNGAQVTVEPVECPKEVQAALAGGCCHDRGCPALCGGECESASTL